MRDPLAEPTPNPISMTRPNSRFPENGDPEFKETAETLNLAAHTTVDPDIRGGEPCITGTRVPVAEIAALLADGVQRDHIGHFYPTVAVACGWDIRGGHV
jgi:uncharacterized protein (DUF433 family)